MKKFVYLSAYFPVMIKSIPLIKAALKPMLWVFLIVISYLVKGQPVKPSFNFKTVVIDAGHGGKDPGAHGAYSLEKNVALTIAKKTKRLINKQMDDVTVILTRSTDRFIELNKRAETANKSNANLFISIHCNSTPEGIKDRAEKERGVLLLVYGYHRKEEQMEALRENASIYIEKDYQKNYTGYNENNPSALIVLNAFMAKYRKQSILFAEILNKEFVNNDGRKSAGVKEQGVLVLAHSAMPAVLVETGYINNPKEENYLNSETGQDEIARSIVDAIKIYRSEINTK